MKKKAVMILLTAILGFSNVMSPSLCASAQESAQEETGGSSEEEDKSLLERGAEIGSDLYEKMDEMVDSVDKKSLRRSIREALEEMDALGISPTVIAEQTLGIKAVPDEKDGSASSPGDLLIKDAQREVRKKTEGFFSMLWDKFLDTLESMISTGISIFAGQDEKNA